RVEVDRLVLDPEWVVEALELRHAHVQRHLAAFEVLRDAAACALPLRAASRRLAATAAGAATDPDVRAVRAGRRLQIVQLHQLCSSTFTRWGTLATMPRISGRSGSVFDLPMRPSPRARNVPRCFGLAPIPDR